MTGDPPQPSEFQRQVQDLRDRGYFPLPLPTGKKAPPPLGWDERVEPYDIPEGSNVGLRTRGEVAWLITNDAESSASAEEAFGRPFQLTKRGGRWAFSNPGKVKNLANAKTEWGEMELHTGIGGDGEVAAKYIVVPPSLHPDGDYYRWVNGGMPRLAGVDSPLPSWLPSLWPAAALGAGKRAGGRSAPDASQASRHKSLKGQIAAAIRKGKKWPEIRAEATAFRDRHADPTLREVTDAEIDRLGEWFGVNVVATNTASGSGPGTTDQPRTLFEEHADRKTGRVSYLPIQHRFAEAVAELFHPATFEDSRETYAYTEGIYVPGETVIHGWVEARFREKEMVCPQVSFTNLAFGVKGRTYVNRNEWLLPGMGLLATRSGTLRLKDRERLDWSPAHHLLSRVAVPYDPTATCPKTLAFLERAVPVARDRDAVIEMGGYLLMDGNPYQKSMMLYGPKFSGKSTWARVLTGVLGRENVASETLGSLCMGRFSTAQLFGKMANIFSDLPERRIDDLALFKALTGEDEVPAQRKFHHPFYFRWGGKAIFSCNQFPEIGRMDPAFVRRWVCVGFPNVLPIECRVAGLSETLVAEEGSGILNLLLEGLDRLVQRGGFDPMLDDEGVAALWAESTDPFRAFIREEVAVDAAGRWEKGAFHDAYVAWAHRQDIEPETKDWVGKHLSKYVPAKADRLPDKERTRVWSGIKPKSGEPSPQGPNHRKLPEMG